MKNLNLQLVMIPVLKCLNKTRARGLNRRKIQKYCKLLDEEYGDLILHCEVCCLSKEQVLKRFWKVKHIFHDFLEKMSCPRKGSFCVIKTGCQIKHF